MTTTYPVTYQNTQDKPAFNPNQNQGKKNFQPNNNQQPQQKPQNRYEGIILQEIGTMYEDDGNFWYTPLHKFYAYDPKISQWIPINTRLDGLSYEKLQGLCIVDSDGAFRYALNGEPFYNRLLTIIEPYRKAQEELIRIKLEYDAKIKKRNEKNVAPPSKPLNKFYKGVMFIMILVTLYSLYIASKVNL